MYRSPLPLVLKSMVKASSLHVGAAAAAAAVRHDLVESSQQLSSEEFNRCFAIARLTPGTNLLALYAAIGDRLTSWWGGLVCLVIGTAVPGAIAVVLAATYLATASHPLVAKFMAGARVGALAVFFWAIVRLIRPIAQAQPGRAAGIAIGTVLATATALLSPFIALLLAGGVGALALRTTEQ